jgi:putative flippase GtrA
MLADTTSRLLRTRFVRFAVAGLVNTLFGYAVYCAALLGGLPVWAALLVGTVIGTLFNFLTTAGYVFRQLTLSRLPRFVFCYALVYVLNLGLIRVLTLWLHDEKLSQLVLVFPVALISYLLMSRLVFPTQRRPLPPM